MEVEDSEPKNVEIPTVALNGVVLPPVGRNESGIGYPYAPENWPETGDNWRWKVGSRITKREHHIDRYLYAPKRLPKPRLFASKASIERYVRKEFPGTDVDAFFAMFTWNIPATKAIGSNADDPMASSSSESSTDMEDGSGSESQLTKCPAGKISCKGFLLEDQKPIMPCDICCAQSDFCRHCSCILCCKNVKSAFGGYSYFRCEAVVSEAYICGHVAHLDCALRCYMAGTVGGIFDIDASYYCRRCDSRSDLVPHATKFVETCKSIDSAINMEKILKLGICILRGSRREAAQVLLRPIKTAYYKLKKGSPLEGIWEAEDNPSGVLSNVSNVMPQTTITDISVAETAGQNNVVASSPDEQEIIPLKLEDEIHDTLRSLKKSQEAEYQLAEEKLHAQKTYLINLREQLKQEKSVLANHTSSADHPSDMADTVLSRTEQIKRELKKLRDMEKVFKGFCKLPRIDQHFNNNSD
uniref:Oberon PHD finger domain-containing protein n=1 Tax=Kalanchoe fedtschenkoi TaxID=63787 RepID=A0A7N0TF35_KALFE